MARVEVLIELDAEVGDALETFSIAGSSLDEGRSQVESLLPSMNGLAYRPTAKPIPMFTLAGQPDTRGLSALRAFASPETSDDLPSVTQVIPLQVEEDVLGDLQSLPGVRVWPSSPVSYFRTDCPPFRPAVSIEVIRAKLGLSAISTGGTRGSGVVVGLLDEGINGVEYPVVGGYARAGAQQPGAGAIDSHGSMCAADVLVAAPDAKLLDYPFLVLRSGGALMMLNAVLDQRRRDGTPHVVSNSWGFYAVPSTSESGLILCTAGWVFSFSARSSGPSTSTTCSPASSGTGAASPTTPPSASMSWRSLSRSSSRDVVISQCFNPAAPRCQDARSWPPRRLCRGRCRHSKRPIPGRQQSTLPSPSLA